MSDRPDAGARAIALAALIGALVGLVAISRPAKVRVARVTAVSADHPAVAHVALAYGRGAAPHSVVIDVRGPSCRGSVTVEGARRFADVLLDGRPGGPYHLAVTAAYRVVGRGVVRRLES